MGRYKNLSDFEKCQIATASQLGEIISKTMWHVSSMQWLEPTNSDPKEDDQ